MPLMWAACAGYQGCDARSMDGHVFDLVAEVAESISRPLGAPRAWLEYGAQIGAYLKTDRLQGATLRILLPRLSTFACQDSMNGGNGNDALRAAKR